MNALRLARTVAPLRPVQIYGRARFKLFPPRPELAPAPQRRELAGWAAPVAGPPALTGPNEARFLNETASISGAGAWNDPGRAKLWLYNLHYFDELAAPADGARSAWRRDLVARWIAENPPGAGNGWEPYPTSLRIVSWIKWALAGEPFEPGWLDSLAAQARWLMRRLEWHLLGNHLFANAKALVFAGLFFAGSEAERWLAKGLAILAREIPEQILADGGHFELTPMYHSILLEDVLDLINLCRAAGREMDAWREAAERMGRWLAAMTHPDGRIAFFNDAAFGIAPEPAELYEYMARLGIDRPEAPANGATHLRESGYVRLQNAAAVVLIDVAKIGPDYLPGHAHADTLSFELSVGRERVVVNGGTSTYAGRSRVYERSTAAHSTVEVAGENSSEVWASFRAGRRARVVALEVADEAVSAAHDGYRALPGRPVHRRRWRLEAERLVVEDEVSAAAVAVARFHLAPRVATGEDGDRAVALRTCAGRALRIETSAPLVLEPSRWASEFGRIEPTTAVVAPAAPVPLRTVVSW